MHTVENDDGEWRVAEKSGRTVCATGEDAKAEADAHRIAQALNTHDAMRAALEAADERIVELSAFANIPAEGETLTEIRAALALTE